MIIVLTNQLVTWCNSHHLQRRASLLQLKMHNVRMSVGKASEGQSWIFVAGEWHIHTAIPEEVVLPKLQTFYLEMTWMTENLHSAWTSHPPSAVEHRPVSCKSLPTNQHKLQEASRRQARIQRRNCGGVEQRSDAHALLFVTKRQTFAS